jgi:hypothetical protein
MIVRNKNPDLFVLGEEAVVDSPAEPTQELSDKEAGRAEPQALDLGLDPFRIQVAETNAVDPGGGMAAVALGGAAGPAGFPPGLLRNWRARARRVAVSSRALIAAPLLAIAALATPMVARELRSHSPGKPAGVPAIAQLPVTPRASAGRDMTPGARVPERSRRLKPVRNEASPSRPIDPPTSSSAASPPVPSDPVSASASPAPTGGGSADRESFGIEK